MTDPWEYQGRVVWRQVVDYGAGDFAGEWPSVLVQAIGETCRQAFMEGLAVSEARGRGYDNE